MKAIRDLRTATRKAIKAVNNRAAQRLSRGDYRTAETLVAKAREIQQFEADIDGLRARWRQVSSAGKGGKKPVTPLWQYYQPVLRALVSGGGSMSLAEIEAAVGQAMAEFLLAGDLVSGSRGKERWRVMVQRCRRPLLAEGWLEKRPGKNWRITEAGRKAAERPTKPDR
jgi:hypothetical protein